MTGSLQSKNGKYYSVLNFKDESGKRKQKWIDLHISSKPGNKMKADKAHRQLLVEYDNKSVENVNLGIDAIGKDVLFCDYINIWLKEAKSGIQLITYEGYKSYVDLHIFPYFKALGITLSELRYQHIQGYYDTKKAELSANSIKKHHVVINSTLKKAVKQELIPTNPATDVTKPKVERFTGSYLTVEQGKILLDGAKGTNIEPAIILGMMYGLRRSEIAGLKWSAIDFDNNTLIVQHTVTRFKTTVAKDDTKNRSSKRILPLNRDVKAYLLNLRVRQSEDKLLLGRAYQETEYVCRWPDGHAMNCDYLSRGFKRLLIKLGLPEKTRLHDLRHSCASYMLKMGCSMKEVSDWLGHSDIKTAMNVYAHLDFESKQDVAERFSSLLSL